VLVVSQILVAIIRAQRGPATTAVRWGVRVGWAYTIVYALAGAWALLRALTWPDVRVAVTIQPMWPGLSPAVFEMGGPTASVVSGGFTTAELTVSGLSLSTRWLIGGSNCLSMLTLAGVGLVMTLACRGLLRHQAFLVNVAKVAAMTAGAIIPAYLATRLLASLGAWRAGQEIFVWTSAAYTSTDPNFNPLAWWPKPTWQLHLDFWPFLVALGLVAFARLVWSGVRLQRDTAGLV
jgi:hypothetical protein